MNDIINNLEVKWTNLLRRYTNDEIIIKDSFKSLCENYQSESRHHHNFEHLQTMFNFIEEHADKIVDLDMIYFSVWFHDFVYNFVYTNNEELSANCAKDFLKKIDYDREKYKDIYKYIIRTAFLDIFKSSDPYDLRLFLDSDIIIFAADVDKYLDYTQKIRKEYHLLSDARYHAGRLKFLKKLLKSTYIYHLQENRLKYEPIARLNLTNEMNMLLRMS